MAAKPLPVFIDPLLLCTNGTVLEGELKLQHMPRLIDVLIDKSKTVKIHLNFFKDEQRVNKITGTIDADLILTCQRCMKALNYNMLLNVNLCPVTPAQEIKLSADCEPLIVSDEPLKLAEIIEDEILLNLPIAAKHEFGKCSS